MSDLLLEDGVSSLLLEDGASKSLLEVNNSGSAFGFTYTLPTISGTHTDFVVTLREDDFPTGAKDGGATSILNGGGNLRAYTTYGRLVRLPLDISIFVTGVTPEIIVYVKIPSAYTGATFYLEADNSSTTQPAATHTYGRNAVWSGALASLHLEEDPSGSAPQMVDSSGNGFDGTSNGTMTIGDSVAAQIGNGLDLDGTDDSVDIGEDIIAFDDEFTIETWVKLNNKTGYYAAVGASVGGTTAKDYFILIYRADANGWTIQWNEGPSSATWGTPTADATVGVLHHLVMTVSGKDGDKGIIYQDGVKILDHTYAIGSFASGIMEWSIGSWSHAGNLNLPGTIDNVAIYRGVKSADWAATRHSNQSAAGAWGTAGSWALTLISLDIQSIAQTQLIDNIDIAKNSVLSTQDISQLQNIDSAVLTQHNLLAINELLQSQSVENVVLTQHNILSVNEMLQGQTVDSVTLTQHNNIAVDGVDQSQAVDGVLLTQHGILVVDEVLQGQTVENITLTVSGSLTVQGVDQSQTIDLLSLAQHNIIVVADVNQVQNIDPVVLFAHDILIVDDISQFQSIDSVGLTQNNILEVSDVSQSQMVQILNIGASFGKLGGTIVLLTPVDGTIVLTAPVGGLSGTVDPIVGSSALVDLLTATININ